MTARSDVARLALVGAKVPNSGYSGCGSISVAKCLCLCAAFPMDSTCASRQAGSELFTGFNIVQQRNILRRRCFRKRLDIGIDIA